MASKAKKVKARQVRFSIQRLRVADPKAAVTTGRPTDILLLSRLPVGMQETLAILLLLPVGALITAVFRNIVGLQTFGTFTPSLLALSFLYADWRSGLVILAGVFGIGLAGRSLLDRLRPLMVPRLSVVLTMVVVFTAFVVSALNYFALTFPEGELFAVAGLLLIGRHSGYRLAELVRFRDLARTAMPGA